MKSLRIQVIIALPLITHGVIAKEQVQTHSNISFNSRRLQARQGGLFAPTSFCAPSGNGVYETIERSFFMAWLSRLVRRQWTDGNCGDVCSDICKHKDCMDDYIISSNGEKCECLFENSTPKCGNRAKCVDDTCQCEDGLFGDPYINCEAPPIEITTSAPTEIPTKTPTEVPTLVRTISDALFEVQFCVEGGEDCPTDHVCCETTMGKSCMKPEACCPSGEVFDPLCGCMAANEVCCGDRKPYIDACPCAVIGGMFCDVGFHCIKSNRGLNGECVKEGCTDSSMCSEDEQCCAGKCISINECCSGCNDLTEKCCKGSCIQQTLCCSSIDGNTCTSGGCANDAGNNRCCPENQCGDDCCVEGETCSDELECLPVGHDCSRFDPCCNPQSCTDYAGIFGDPHIGTFDGLAYDCQAAGEFLLARSVNSAFRVNGFFKEVSSNQMTVSVLNGIAIQPSGDEPLVQLVVDEREIRIWIGGNEMMNTTTGFVGEKIEVRKRYENYYDIFCKDASIEIAVLEWKVGLVLNFLMKLKKKNTNQVVGLLGTPDGNLNNEWVEMFGETKFSDEVQICSNEAECASNMATDYCMKNWCVTTKDNSLFRLNDGNSFFNEAGCRAPLSYQTTVAAPQSRRLQIDLAVKELCGNELACLLDGSLFGYDAAKSTVVAQTGMLDSLVINASPSRFLVSETTPVTITVAISRDDYDSLYTTSVGSIDESEISFVLYTFLSSRGERDLSMTQLLRKDESKSNARVVAFSTNTNLMFTTPGEFYGFDAVPLINGALNYSLSISRGRVVRSYTSFGIGACFQSNAELRAAAREYATDGSLDALVTKKYGFPIGSWCVSKVQDFTSTFKDLVTFNEEVNDWNISQATNLDSMFYNASSFNKNLDKWDVRNVQSMNQAFRYAISFAGNISNWDVSSVTNMLAMFSGTEAFDLPINDWDVSRVTTMRAMFRNALAFNQDLNNWNVAKVESMKFMFMFAEGFNRDISAWNLSSVDDMDMFLNGASNFNRSLCAWGAQLFGRTMLITNTMFESSNCISKSEPNLTVSPVTPLCHPCP